MFERCLSGCLLAVLYLRGYLAIPAGGGAGGGDRRACPRPRSGVESLSVPGCRPGAGLILTLKLLLHGDDGSDKRQFFHRFRNNPKTVNQYRDL